MVQYLATYYDPETRLPVLFMELCDQSLTTFLERSPGPLSYHIQIIICHDIALALVYLHSNDLIHRDLTGNNVLMIAGTRAKITDFGMSKLATVNPRMMALTLCPGNLLYMSPEALDEAKSYTAKLDIFSFGVIVIQILTREFPNPTDRFRSVKVAEFEEEVRVVVPETERRQSQLKLIPDTHSLKPVVLQCLKKEGQRPSAVELSERLSELKQSSQYTESQCQTQSSSDIQQLQQQLRGQRILTEAKTREVSERETRITELEEEKQHLIETNVRQLQENQRSMASMAQTVAVKERESCSRHSNGCKPVSSWCLSFSRAYSRKTRPSVTSNRPYQHMRERFNSLSSRTQSVETNHNSSQSLDHKQQWQQLRKTSAR